RQGECAEFVLQTFVGGDDAGRFDEVCGEIRPLAAQPVTEAGDQRVGEQRVVGLPAREGVAVVPGEEELVLAALLDRQRDRRGEAAVERKGRALAYAGEAHDMTALLHMDDAVLDCRAFRGPMRHVLSVRSDKAEGERYV